MPPSQVVSLKNMSDRDFVSFVTKLTSDMRSLETSYKNDEERVLLNRYDKSTTNQVEQEKRWNEQNNRMFEIGRRLNFEWQTKFRSRSILSYEDLCRRLGIVPYSELNNGVPSREKDKAILLRYGSLAGPTPISDLADYLDSLSNQLN